jgi:hypothetical protein
MAAVEAAAEHWLVASVKTVARLARGSSLPFAFEDGVRAVVGQEAPEPVPLEYLGWVL